MVLGVLAHLLLRCTACNTSPPAKSIMADKCYYVPKGQCFNWCQSIFNQKLGHSITAKDLFLSLQTTLKIQNNKKKSNNKKVWKTKTETNPHSWKVSDIHWCFSSWLLLIIFIVSDNSDSVCDITSLSNTSFITAKGRGRRML